MKDKLIFTEAMNFWIKKRGMSHAALADKMGINRNTVTQYISGLRTPPMDRLEDLVSALGLTIPEFFACRDDSLPDIVFVNRVKARPRAGTGGLETDGEHEGKYPFHSSFIARKRGTPDDMKIFQIAGDSMNPLLDDGDLIMINTKDTVIRTGYIYLLRMEDELMVKRLENRPGGILLIRSDNPAYDDLQIDKNNEATNIEIFGRMVWSCREY